MNTNTNVRDMLHALIKACVESERNIHIASEHMQNQGVKLLLKRYAQQRYEFAQGLQALDKELEGTGPRASNLVGDIRRGWTDLKVSMTVGRENRQHEALSDLRNSEQAVLEAYEEALEVDSPSWLRDVLLRQRNQIRMVYDEVVRLMGDSEERLLVRVFDSHQVAQQAVKNLENAGFEPRSVDVEVMQETPAYAAEDVRERARSANSAVLTGALIGAVIGVLFGVGYGFLRLEFDPEVVLTGSERLWSIITSGLIGAAVGASFGSFFGFWIGRNAVEEDTELYAQTVHSGEELVLVTVPVGQVEEVERLLLMEHQHELSHVPA